MFRLFLLIVLISSISKVFADDSDANVFIKKAESGETIYSISMSALLAVPEKYDGKIISVVGFVSFQFEDTAIYFHKEDYDQMLMGNSYWLSGTLSDIPKFNLRYANVTGRFFYKRSGHKGIWSGEITDITSISPAISRADIKAFRQKSK